MRRGKNSISGENEVSIPHNKTHSTKFFNTGYYAFFYFKDLFSVS